MELTISKQTPNQHEDNNILRMLIEELTIWKPERGEPPLKKAPRKIKR